MVFSSMPESVSPWGPVSTFMAGAKGWLGVMPCMSPEKRLQTGGELAAKRPTIESDGAGMSLLDYSECS